MPPSRRRGRSLLSPSGFAFVVLCFFLPFVTLSCESGMGDLYVTYTGLDLALDRAPTVEGSAASLASPEAFRAGAMTLLLVSLVLSGVGFLVTLLVGHRPTQMLLGLVLAVLALGALTTDLSLLYQEHNGGPRSDALGLATTQSSIGVGLWATFGLLAFLVLFHLFGFVGSLRERGVRPPPGS
ncbi:MULTISPECIES: hypothetical protein [unclassified Nocardiopsis]|uniref:hypothetical protein n=1 Tax=unclassified Nocardiopsis TaxID=2649073 RepID=UPI00066AC20F|nr:MULTISPECIES: hypothetical protein [unclassified Nocardiopsis]MBQ1080261.1 hypothetical protein [Nocardiopsis sp. B62]